MTRPPLPPLQDLRDEADRLGEVERRLAQLEDDETRFGHEPRPLGPAIHEWLGRKGEKK